MDARSPDLPPDSLPGMTKPAVRCPVQAGAASAASRRWRTCSPRCGRRSRDRSGASCWRSWALAISSPSAIWIPATGRPRSPAVPSSVTRCCSLRCLSNAMAIVLQSLCTRLGVGAGRDLAQACRDSFPRWVSLPLWLSAEVAITATDLAEVIGTAIGLNLLFHIPLAIGVIITAARRVSHPGAAGLRLPLDRSLRGGDARRDRGVLCGADRARRSRLGRGASGALCRARDLLANPRDALSRARHFGRDRDAA